MEDFNLMLSSVFGTTFYSFTVFVCGALFGAPLWYWVCEKLPWYE